MKFKPLLLFTTILITVFSLNIHAQNNCSVKMQLEVQPEEVGIKIVKNLADRRFGWRYQKVCSSYGSMIFTEAINDTVGRDRIINEYKPYLNGNRKPHSGHVDYNVFGIWPFEIYRQTGDEQYLAIPKKLADDEFINPRKDGLTELTRFWVDDMYMVGSLQVQAYKSLKDEKYLDRAAMQLLAYCDSLQKPNGLFFHRSDAPFYWGRGNGWGAAAMAELLLVLPENHKQYPALAKAYRKMMAGLLRYQGEDGMWHQLIDNPTSYAETSSTGMFLFAMISGVDKGLLPCDEYREAIEKGWNALAGYVNEKGEVTDVCMWTNASRKENHYLKRRRITGDYHGQAAVLWATTAMVRLQNHKSK